MKAADRRRSQGGTIAAGAALMVALLAAPAPARASIQPLGMSSSSSTPTSALTWPHVTGDGLDGYLVVGVALWQLPPASPEVQAVSYGGSPLTRLGFAVNAEAVRVEIWGMTAPPAGSFPVDLRLSGQAAVVAGAAAFGGVDATNGVGPFLASTGVDPMASLVVPSAAGEYVVDVFGSAEKAGAVGTGQTELWNLSEQISGAGGGAPGAPSVTVLWSSGARSRPWTLAAVTLRPAPERPVDDGGADGANAPDAPDAGTPDAGTPDAVDGGSPFEEDAGRPHVALRIGWHCDLGAGSAPSLPTIIVVLIAAVLVCRSRARRAP